MDRARRPAIVLAVAFFVLCLPLCGSLARWHGDERFYVDAALRMHELGGWLEPRYADGAPRLNKPFLSYWAIASSFTLGGVSALTARLPSLLAAAAIVALTGRLAAVFARGARDAAMLGAAFVLAMSDLPVFGTRATPDILLALGCTASLLGIASADEGECRSAAWWFWGGVGVAAAAKGGLAIAIVVTGFAIAMRHGFARRLARPLPMLVGGVVAFSGFLGILVTPAGTGVESLYGDQVGEKVASDATRIPLELGRYVLDLASSMIVPLALWIATVGRASWRRRAARVDTPLATGPRSRATVELVWMWTLVLLLVFSASKVHRARYLLPCQPVLAAWMAAACATALADVGAVRRMRIAARSVLALMCAVLVIVAGGLVRIDARTAGVLAFVALGVAFFAWRGGRHSPATLATAIALACVACVGLGIPYLRARLDPVAAVEQAAELTRDGAHTVATIGLHDSEGTLLRLASGAVLHVQSVGRDVPSTDTTDFDALVFREADLERVRSAGWSAQRCGSRQTSPSIRRALDILASDDPRAELESLRENAWIGRRPIQRGE